MQGVRQLVVARISAETSASAHLGEVVRWLIAAQSKLLRFVADELPALGQDSLLRLGRPITAPARALRIVAARGWRRRRMPDAGQLRFVAHPTGSDVRMSFSGGTRRDEAWAAGAGRPSSAPAAAGDRGIDRAPGDRIGG